MCRLTYHCENTVDTVEILPGTTILEAMLTAGVYIDAPCGGNGKCMKCLCRASGELSERTLAEKSLPEGLRLACRTLITGDAEVYINRSGSALVEIGGKYYGSKPVSLRSNIKYAAAVDIGTTTVVVYLHDLNDGKRIGAAGKINGQRIYGADVISRISACFEPESLDILRKIITDEINELLTELCSSNNIPRDLIGYCVIAGNTTMELIFAGISPVSLAALPFISPSLFGSSISASEAGLEIGKEASVYIMPCAASFVGGDITAAVIASSMYLSDKPSLLLDIGTNGEMALGCRTGITCCATAAGPAFEGADITKGMSSLPGAISSVSYNDGLKLRVIGDISPAGICGSGLIDALAVMLDLGAVDETGRLLPPQSTSAEAQPFVDITPSGSVRFFLDRKGDVYISDSDVRKLQVAKAAIRAGIETLLEEACLSVDAVDKLYISGGFGSHISFQSAVRIGLIPDIPPERVVILGNGSGEGAVLTAISENGENNAENTRNLFTYTELSASSIWSDFYIDNMTFEND